MSMKDQNNELQEQKLLVEGSYFGEIALIYKCLRTSDIMAKNYVSLASIKKNQFLSLLGKVDNLQRMMVRQIQMYTYARKDFMYKVIRKIDFLKDITIKQFNEIYYGLERKYYEKGAIVLKEGENVNAFIIVENGLLELSTDFDGNRFSVLRLP